MPIRRTIAGFDVLVFPGDKIDAKPILLLHGANGQPPDFLAFAQRLSNDGFIVYAPAVMGHALEHGLLVTVRNMLILRLSGDFERGHVANRECAIAHPDFLRKHSYCRLPQGAARMAAWRANCDWSTLARAGMSSIAATTGGICSVARVRRPAFERCLDPP